MKSIHTTPAKVSPGTVAAAVITAMAVMAALCGCTRKIYIPVQSDTVRSDSVARVIAASDTVIIRDSVCRFVSGDTVFLRQTTTRDRIRILRDTLCVLRRDSVRTEVPIPVPGPQQSSRPSWPAIALVILTAAIIAALIHRWRTPLH